MKILLTRPNTWIVKTLPMGLLYIASYLQKYSSAKYDIEILDLRVLRWNIKQTRERLEALKPDIVGISAVNMEATATHQLADLVKLVNPECKVVIGGPYPSSWPEAVMGHQSVDYAVIGEGEETMRELVQRIEHGQTVEKVRGIAYRREDGEMAITEPRNYLTDLDSLPLPAYDLINVEKYFTINTHHVLQARSRYLPIFTSRGCPFRCIYCHNIFGKRFRTRSPENVISEIEFLHNKYKVEEVHIEDDSFNVDKDRAANICDLISEKVPGLKIAFPNGIRADLVDEQLLRKFKRAGVYSVAYGIESGSPRIQKLIRKNLDLESALNSINLTARLKIITIGFFMIGFPGETREDILKTITFAKKASLHLASFTRVIPFPGTELSKMGTNSGLELCMDPQEFRTEATSINLTAISAKELNDLETYAYRSFYLNVQRLISTVKIMPNKFRLFTNLGLRLVARVIPMPLNIKRALFDLAYR